MSLYHESAGAKLKREKLEGKVLAAVQGIETERLERWLRATSVPLRELAEAELERRAEMGQ